MVMVVEGSKIIEHYGLGLRKGYAENVPGIESKKRLKNTTLKSITVVQKEDGAFPTEIGIKHVSLMTDAMPMLLAPRLNDCHVTPSLVELF